MSATKFAVDSSFLDDETLHEAYELEIQSKNGDPVRFGELVAGKGDSITSIVVFIRHFFCTYDQDYVRSLAGKMSQNLLDKIPEHAKPAQIIIIGCGDSQLIEPYSQETSDKFPIYTDSSGAIYEKLRMKRSFTGLSDPPPYAKQSFLPSLFEDLKQRWKQGWLSLKGGSGSQQGGEWVFQGGKLKYAHRMESANDHLTADQLVDVLKLDEPKDSDE